MMLKAAAFAIIVCFFLIGCAEKATEVEQVGEIKLSSPAFKDNGFIPVRYTCKGEDVNPPLIIEDIPNNTKSLALIVDDPDAPSGDWVHWIVWNIPVVAKIDEDSVPIGAVQGINDFGKREYGGPCPPSGTHRYFFKLYALDSRLELSQSARKPDLEKAMKGHVLAQTKLIGLFSK